MYIRCVVYKNMSLVRISQLNILCMVHRDGACKDVGTSV